MMLRLSHDFKELGRKEGAPPSFGMSFGVSAHPEDDGTVSRIVKAADDRLLLSKQNNKVALPFGPRRSVQPLKTKSSRIK